MTIRKIESCPPRGYVDGPQTWASDDRPALAAGEDRGILSHVARPRGSPSDRRLPDRPVRGDPRPGGSVMVLGSPKQRDLLPGVSHDQALGYALEVFHRVMLTIGAGRRSLPRAAVALRDHFPQYLCPGDSAHRPGEPSQRSGMVQKRPFSGNTRDLSADPDRSRVGAGLRDPRLTCWGFSSARTACTPGVPASERAAHPSATPRGFSRLDWGLHYASTSGGSGRTEATSSSPSPNAAAGRSRPAAGVKLRQSRPYRSVCSG